MALGRHLSLEPVDLPHAYDPLRLKHTPQLFHPELVARHSTGFSLLPSQEVSCLLLLIRDSEIYWTIYMVAINSLHSGP